MNSFKHIISIKSSNAYSKKNNSVYNGSSFNIKFPNFVNVSTISLKITTSSEFSPPFEPEDVITGLIYLRATEKNSIKSQKSIIFLATTATISFALVFISVKTSWMSSSEIKLNLSVK